MHILFGIHWGCPLGHVVVPRVLPVVAIIHKDFFSFLDISQGDIIKGKANVVRNLTVSCNHSGLFVTISLVSYN
mgnify:CR=1 FL=1